MMFIPNCHWNHTKIEVGMIPMAIWCEYHTSVFAVHDCNFACLRHRQALGNARKKESQERILKELIPCKNQ